MRDVLYLYNGCAMPTAAFHIHAKTSDSAIGRAILEFDYRHLVIEGDINAQTVAYSVICRLIVERTIRREEIFVTVIIPSSHVRPAKLIKWLQQLLDGRSGALPIGWVDAAVVDYEEGVGDYIDIMGTWQSAECVWDQCLTRHLAVRGCSFMQLRGLLGKECRIKPAFLLCKHNVLFKMEKELLELCARRDIKIISQQPLGPSFAHGDAPTVVLPQRSALTTVARQTNMTCAQTCLLWLAQMGHGFVVDSELDAKLHEYKHIWHGHLSAEQLDELRTDK